MKTSNASVSTREVIKLFVPECLLLMAAIGLCVLSIWNEFQGIWISFPFFALSVMFFWEIPKKAFRMVCEKAYERLEDDEDTETTIYNEAKEWFKSHSYPLQQGFLLGWDELLWKWFGCNDCSRLNNDLGFRDISPARLSEEVEIAYKHLSGQMQEELDVYKTALEDLRKKGAA